MFELLPWNCSFVVCLFVCLFLLLLLFFFIFSPQWLSVFAFFCTNFVVSFYQHNFFCECVFLCVPSLTFQGILFWHISLIFVGVWQVLSFAFFQFCSLQWTKISCLLLCIFLLVHLLLPPAPTSLIIDPRVFSFSSIAAAEKRARSPWWWCCLTYSLPQLSRVNSPVSN